VDEVAGQPNTVRTCYNGDAGDDPLDDADLGPGVRTSSAAFVDPPAVVTFTQGPGPADDTLYVALEGRHAPTPRSLNFAGGNDLLGVVTFTLPPTDPPVDPPQLTFTGVTNMPGVVEAITPADALGAITPNNVSLVNSFDGDEDSDGDGVPDDSDNCPYFMNGNELLPGGEPQGNNGGVATTATDDGVGDLCQCGDATGDGIVTDAFAVPTVTEDDVTTCQQVLAACGTQSPCAVPPGAPFDAADVERCAVANGEQRSIVDILIMELELNGEDSGAAIGQVCTPAVP